MALTDKQQQFVTEYLIGFNATEAYAKVYAPKARESAASSGYKLLRIAEIAEAISQRLQEKAMSADEVLARLGEQARNEHGKYITATGLVNLPQLIADGKGHLVKGIKETQYGKNIEFYDAQAALVHIGKHHGLFKDVSEIKGETTMKVIYGDDGTNDPAT